MSPLGHPLVSTLALALVLLPARGPTPRRDLARDVESLRQSECEYRGIRARYDELSRAYVLKTYARGQLLRWQARPSPHNPDSETLVTALFRVEYGPEDGRPSHHYLRAGKPPHIGITWRYSTLAVTRVEPANEYARAALETFARTVDDFIARMVVATDELELAATPAAGPAPGARVDRGTVLFVEERRAGWVQVRLPSTSRRGWVRAHLLRPVE